MAKSVKRRAAKTRARRVEVKRARPKTHSRETRARRGTVSRGRQAKRAETEALRRVALIVGDAFEDSEFKVPYERLRQNGYDPVVVGANRSKILVGKNGRVRVKPDRSIDAVSDAEFAALVIPGGYSPDHLRTDPRMVSLTRSMFEAKKPVAAVCHAGSLLIEADIVRDRTVTSWPSIRTDLVNAGAQWVDREVVEDENLITARKPEDLRAFTDALLRQLERRASEASPAPSSRVPHQDPEAPA